jgi:hypothetical protein
MIAAFSGIWWSPAMFVAPDDPLPGQTVTLLYPRKNRHGKSLCLEKREVLVLEVIDGAVTPIELGAFLRRPRVKRGRRRLEAYDPRRLAVRTFHIDWHSPTKLQLGRYNPLFPGDYEPIGEPFEQTPSGIKELTEMIREIMKEPAGGETTLGLFAA